MGIHGKSERGAINFRARFEYLEATVKHWPELLGSLPLVDISPQAMGRWPDTIAELNQLREFDEGRQAILEWAKQHSIKDVWILDAAVQTVSKDSARERWHYIVSELPIQEFAVTFGTWFPMQFLESGPVTWAEFKKTAVATFNRKLKEYHQAVETTWGVERPSLKRHAVWTVLWQKGKSAEQISQYERSTEKSRVTAASILISVHAFAAEIGLTRRDARSGPKRRT
jgi:hypothetical protein